MLCSEWLSWLLIQENYVRASSKLTGTNSKDLSNEDIDIKLHEPSKGTNRLLILDLFLSN